ncbi:fibronectin type III domain-containing protein [Candidatus Woesearchaeota archaeon]|nr:MAG: fibronectin type III domain-containing protein [Candidatus Woesearchaeota archaeon]
MRFDWKKSVLAILIALFSLQKNVLAANWLNDFFSEFANFDMARIYSQYHSFIDFFIYVMIFVGIGQVTLYRIYKGKDVNNAAKAVSVGVGLALAIALTVFKPEVFSISTLGPIAAIIIVILLGIVLFGVLRPVTGDSGGSAAIALIVTYFVMRGVVPSVYNWIKQHAPFINGFMGIVILIAIIRAFQWIWRALSGRGSGGGDDGGSGGGDDGGGGGGILPRRRIRDEEDEGPPRRRGWKPNKVHNFNVRHMGDHVQMWWDPRPDDERITFYEIQKKSIARFGFFREHTIWRLQIQPTRSFTWRTVYHDVHVGTQANPVIDNFKVKPGHDYKYRIAASNEAGRGPYAYTETNLVAQNFMPIILNVTVDHDGNATLEGVIR